VDCRIAEFTSKRVYYISRETFGTAIGGKHSDHIKYVEKMGISTDLMPNVKCMLNTSTFLYHEIKYNYSSYLPI